MVIRTLRHIAAICSLLAFLPTALNVAIAKETIQSTPSVITGVVTSDARQHTDYYHILYLYLQNDHINTLGYIDKGFSRHGFTALSEQDFDRVALIQGASKLHLGLYEKAQRIFLSLLNTSSSDYVIAQTWYWLAKSGFENKQQFRSEQAYAAIESQDLVEHLSFEQWQELTYLAAHARMVNAAEWQPLFEQLHESTIFPAYLQANYAVELFNKGKFEEAESYFVSAKQSLITHRDAQTSVYRTVKQFTSDVVFNLSPRNWFSIDPNRRAQKAQEDKARAALESEQNALFDQINLFLSYTLLQKKDDINAQAVIKQVSSKDIQANDALLMLGWAYAQESMYEDAISAWSHLSETGLGHFQLQARYGLSYAFQQQGEFEKAYFSLDSIVGQIESRIDDLKAFSAAINNESFLDNYQEEWPLQFQGIKRVFLTGSSGKTTLDTRYYLSIREQSTEILATLREREKQVVVLESMLEQRKSRFANRGQALELDSKVEKLKAAKQQIERLSETINSEGNQDKQSLMLSMLSKQDAADWARLQRAFQRHQRLIKDPPRGRPLKASYAQRLNRIQGIIQWQMEDALITQSWRHKRLLERAEQSYETAQQRLAAVNIAQARSPELERDEIRIEMLKQAITEHTEKAQQLLEQSDGLLVTFLNNIIDAQQAELEKQWIDARLARIRLQDMQPQKEGESESQEVSLNTSATDVDLDEQTGGGT